MKKIICLVVGHKYSITKKQWNYKNSKVILEGLWSPSFCLRCGSFRG